MSKKLGNKITSIKDFRRQLAILNEGFENLTNGVEDDETANDEEQQETDDEQSLDDAPETNDDFSDNNDDLDENPEVDEVPEENENEGEVPVEQQDEKTEEENNDEVPEENVSEISEKLDTLIADFGKFRAKTISLLEALLAANRIKLGLSEKETPRLAVEKKKNIGTLNTASGKLKKEVAAIALWMNPEDATLKVTSKTVMISKGKAVEEALEIQGKIPSGDWIVVERKEKYYLVSTENFDTADDVEPYDSEEENNEPSKGQIVNKKGTANNVRGYLLKAHDDYYELTERSLEKPYRVFKAKWTKDCDNQWPVKGNVPEGIWVIVYSNEEDRFYLVKSDDVQQGVSTKKTEEKKSKKAVKKVAVKKVASKKVASKKPAKKNKKK